MRRWTISLVFLLPGSGAGYMAWLGARAGDSGKWLFAVFAGFFLLLAAGPHLKPRPQPESTPPAPTRFVPHWFMLAAIVPVVVALVFAIASASLRH